MLCCVHLTVISLSILKVLRVPLSFSLFNFQGPTHFLESFLSVLTEPLSTVRELLYHTYFRLSTLFSKFLKSFLKSLSLLLKAFSVFSNFSVVCAFLKRLRYYITPFYKLQPLFSIFLNFLFFLKKQFKSRIFVAFSY